MVVSFMCIYIDRSLEVLRDVCLSVKGTVLLNAPVVQYVLLQGTRNPL